MVTNRALPFTTSKRAFCFGALVAEVLMVLLVCLGSSAAASNDPPGHAIGWVRTLSDGAALSEPLTGKIVTAVFQNASGTGIAFFYIQEPDPLPISGSLVGGVKVVSASYPVGLKAGDVVSVAGTAAVDTGGECCISASDITVTGSASVPAPFGISNHWLASDQCGLQPGLVMNPYKTPAVMGRGLPFVGMRVKLWGKITWISADRTQCCISDGWKIFPGVGGTTVKGVRVIYPAGYTCPAAFQVGYFVPEQIVGVLGVEKVGAFFVPVLRVSSNVVYLRPDGDDSRDGLTWAAAKATLQQAIDAAYAMQPKGEVWIAAGEYWTPGYFDPPVELRDGVALYGGFIGSETARDGRDWQANPTSLYLLAGMNVINCGAATRIDGLVLMGLPVIHDGPDVTRSDGLIYCGNSSLVITNNLFQHAWYSDRGGAVCCIGGAPVIDSNSFLDCRADGYNPGYGGAIYCQDTNAVITGNTMDSGIASGRGGAIYCSGGAPIIRRNEITNNRAGSGAGIYCDSSQARVANNVILGNSVANGNGGGIYVAGGSPSVANNTLRDNSAADGGGIYVASGSPVLANNIIAFGSSGISCSAGTPSIVCNDVFGNYQYDFPGQPDFDATSNGNMSVDPLFVDDGFHIRTDSPCAGRGDNSEVRAGDLDMDGDLRIRPSYGRVDIGADETANCGWRLEIIPFGNGFPIGQPVSVTARLSDDNGYPVAGQVVRFVADPGSIAPDPASDLTDADGLAHTSLVCLSGGWVALTGFATDQCGGTLQSTCRARFYDPNAPVDVVFVMDRSGSMLGHEASYPDEGSIQAFVREIIAAKPSTRFGAVVFDTDALVRSISQFSGSSAVDDFCGWIGAFSGFGGTSAQMPSLNAAAADLENCSPSDSRRFVVYITDDYVGTEDMQARKSLVQRLDSLMGFSDGGVFISLWEDWQGSLYRAYSEGFTDDPAHPSLAVNGDFDPTGFPYASTSSGRYPFANLKARILHGL